MVRSSGDVMNRLEREMGREEFNDARPEIAFKRMYGYVTLKPIFLAVTVFQQSVKRYVCVVVTDISGKCILFGFELALSNLGPDFFRALLQSMAAPLVFRRQTVRRINQEALDR